MLRVHPTPSFT